MLFAILVASGSIPNTVWSAPFSGVARTMIQAPSSEAVVEVRGGIKAKAKAPGTNHRYLHNERQAHKRAEKAATLNSRDRGSLWDQGFLKANPKVNKAIREFEAGKRGASVRDFDTSGKSAKQIHREALSKGFTHKREALSVTDKTPYLRSKSGKLPKNRTVPHDIYSHPDTGQMRVKPDGAPGTNRPPAHVSKGIVTDPKGGTAYSNEAAKITNGGKAVPKAPTPTAGLRRDPKAKTPGEVNAWRDGAADAAHTNILPRRR
jgi:hypothetical protein